VNPARIAKALGAFVAALPVGAGVSAAAGGDGPGYLVGVLGAFVIGLVTYLAPENAPKPGVGEGVRGQAP
jgi:hypothetical protein